MLGPEWDAGFWFAGLQQWKQELVDQLHTHKNKGSLLASMVPWGTFNIHGTFPLVKRFFIVEKGSLDYKNVLHTGSLKSR